MQEFRKWTIIIHFIINHGFFVVVVVVVENHNTSILQLGQMIYMDSWRMMMYLGTPVMPDLNSLITTGLYINDLSMHDFSR